MFNSLQINRQYLWILFIALPFSLFGQARVLKGTVYAKEDDSVIANALMYLRGYESQGTYSQDDGKYELIIPEGITTTGKVRLYILPQGHEFPQSIDIPIDFKHVINIQVKSEAFEVNNNLITSRNDDKPDLEEKETDDKKEEEEAKQKQEDSISGSEEEIEVLEIAEEEENNKSKSEDSDSNEILALENQIKSEINAIKVSLENQSLKPQELNALSSRLEKLEKQTSDNSKFKTYGTEIANLKAKVDELKKSGVSFNQNNLIFISILGFIIFLLFILFLLYRKRRKKEEDS